MSKQTSFERFIYATIAAGLAVVLFSIHRLSLAQLDWHFLELAVITIAIGSRLSVRIPQVKAEITVADTLVFFAMLLYGGEAAILLAAAEGLVSTLHFSRKPWVFLFNAAQMSCSTFLTVWVLRFFFGPIEALHRGDQSARYLAAICIMASVQYIANSGMVALCTALRDHQPVWSTWRRHYFWTSITYFAGAAVASITADVIGEVSVYAAIIISPIIAIIYFSYQTYIKNLEASAELRKSEGRYRDIFENAGEGILQTTPECKVITANPALARMIGFDSSAELIRTFNDISREVYVDPIRREELKRLLEEHGFVHGFEHQIFRKDGTRIWVTVNARAVRDERGNILYYEGTVQDTNERKRAEDALRESEGRYRELFENAKDAIYVQDLAGVFTSVNRAAEKLVGYDRSEIIGKHFDQFVAPEYMALVRSQLAKKLADREQTAYEVEAIARDGRRVPIELSSSLIFKNGVAIGIQGIARDITERKRAEYDLRQQKEFLQKIVDHIPVMIRLSGPDGELQLLNREYERTTGWSLEEIKKNNLNIFGELNPDEHERQVILDRIAKAKGDWADFRIRVRDGRVIDTSWTNIQLSAGMTLGIGQDISDRKRTEETLRSYSRRLIEAQEAERQSISRELHDQIGQVLTAIRINLANIAKCGGPKARLLVEEGVALVDHALQQVRNLSFELRPSLLDDLGLASALRWYADRYAQRAGIRVTTTIKLAESRARLSRDLETACFRIVQEALTNVARHAQAKNVLIDLGTLNDGISLTIKDDGIGFDEQSRNAASSPHPLGLRGMQERAMALGGKLEINSASSLGTEIRAHFPNGSKRN